MPNYPGFFSWIHFRIKEVSCSKLALRVDLVEGKCPLWSICLKKRGHNTHETENIALVFVCCELKMKPSTPNPFCGSDCQIQHGLWFLGLGSSFLAAFFCFLYTPGCRRTGRLVNLKVLNKGLFPSLTGKLLLPSHARDTGILHLLRLFFYSSIPVGPEELYNCVAFVNQHTFNKLND